MGKFLLTPTNAKEIAKFTEVFKNAKAEIWQEREGTTLTTKIKIVENYDHAQNINMTLCKENIEGES